MTADLAVVGGGYCGLWTAVLAKRRDPTRRVVLLEQHTVGWAASAFLARHAATVADSGFIRYL